MPRRSKLTAPQMKEALTSAWIASIFKWFFPSLIEAIRMETVVQSPAVSRRCFNASTNLWQSSQCIKFLQALHQLCGFNQGGILQVSSRAAFRVVVLSLLSVLSVAPSDAAKNYHGQVECKEGATAQFEYPKSKWRFKPIPAKLLAPWAWDKLWYRFRFFFFASASRQP